MNELQLSHIVGRLIVRKRAAGSIDAGSQTLWQSHFE